MGAYSHFGPHMNLLLYISYDEMFGQIPPPPPLKFVDISCIYFLILDYFPFSRRQEQSARKHYIIVE